MAIGDILKTQNLIVEQWTVKASENIAKGELVCDDGSGNGVVPATTVLAVTNKVAMSLEDHIYADHDTHEIGVVVCGCVEVKKKTGNTVVKGRKLTISTSEAGKVDIFSYGQMPGDDTYNTEAAQAALNLSLAVIGHAYEESSDSDASQKMWLGTT